MLYSDYDKQLTFSIQLIPKETLQNFFNLRMFSVHRVHKMVSLYDCVKSGQSQDEPLYKHHNRQPYLAGSIIVVS